jgi:hypothetical protein
LKIKKSLLERINESQTSLKKDINTVSSILEELVKMKVSGTELKFNFDDEKDNVCGIVGSSTNVNSLKKVF